MFVCLCSTCVCLTDDEVSTFFVIRMTAYVTIGTLTLSEVLRFCVLHSMSQAWQLGRAIQRARSTHSSVIEAIVEQQCGTLIIVGKVSTLSGGDMLLLPYFLFFPHSLSLPPFLSPVPSPPPK